MAINVPLSAQLQNATQLQQQVQNAVNAVRINLGGPNGARALSSLSQPLGRLTGQADEFTKSLDAANARVLAFGASVGVVNAVANAFKSLVNSTIEVEKAITAISVVGDQFNGKTKELSQGLFNIAKTTGQSFADVSKAALEFSRQGLNLEDTLARTKDSLILTRTTGLDAAKAVEGLTAAVNGFSKAGLSTTQVLNKFAAVDQAFAVSAADLTEAFQRAGAVAEEAGISFDEFSGIITALQTKTSRGGAVIGNALKTIFSRLKETSTLTKLTDLGVAVEDLQGNLLPARQILQNLATDIQGLGEITKAGIFKDVAGTFQLNQLVSLVNDLNNAQSISAAATQKSAGATNEAYVANEKLNQSLDALLNKVAITGKQLGSILGEIGLTDNLKGLLDGVNSFLEDVNGVLQGDDIGSNFAKGFVKGIGAVLSGPGLGIFLAIIAKLSYDLLRFGAESLKTFFGIGKAARDQKQIQESIVQTLLKNQNVLNSILSAQGGQNAQGLKFLGILNQQAAAMQSIQGLAGNIAGTVYSAGYRQTDRGLARRSAGGYLPAQEASDVRRGVGGASPSSKVVSIPNFAFGGGKRGTMVANTSEYIVPNYAGGGSAIFNQDMVKTMGLPAGAKKISAAGGFIPNFATPETRSAKRKENQTASEFALIVNDPIQKPYAKYFPVKGEDVQYLGLVAGINPEKKMQDAKGGAFNDSKFTPASLVEKYTKLAIKDASDYSSAIVGKPITPVSVQRLSNPGVASGLVGAIFENGISAAIQDPEMSRALATRDPNAPFDFIKGVTSDAKLNKFFGIPSSIKYIEAKYSLSEGTASSFGDKIHAELLRRQSGIIKDEKPEKLAGGKTALIRRESDVSRILNSASAKKGSFNFGIAQGFEGKVPQAWVDKLKQAGGIQNFNASTGYIPNFAAAALQQAIAREKSAGLSNSQIYVDQNSSLKSPLNPMGLMVANTRDEPFGGIQGISRARKEGANPKTYGAANGFVPNYASQQTGATSSNIAKVEKGFGDLAGKFIVLQSALSFFQGGFTEAGSVAEKFSSGLQTAVSAIFAYQTIQQLSSKNQNQQIQTNTSLLKKASDGLKKFASDFEKGGGARAATVARGGKLPSSTPFATRFSAGLGTGKIAGGVRSFVGNPLGAIQSLGATALTATIALKSFNDIASLFYTKSPKVAQSLELLSSAAMEASQSLNTVDKSEITGGLTTLKSQSTGGLLTSFINAINPLRLGREQVSYTQQQSGNNKTNTTLALLKGGQSKEDFSKIQSDLMALFYSDLKVSMKDAPASDLKMMAQNSVINAFDAATTTGISGQKELDLEKVLQDNGVQRLIAKSKDTAKKLEIAASNVEFEKPLQQFKRTIEQIIFEGSQTIEDASQDLQRRAKVISAITSSKSFATLGDSSKIAFEINSSLEQFNAEYNNKVKTFLNETQTALTNYLPQLGIAKDKEAPIQSAFEAVGKATNKEGLAKALGDVVSQIRLAGVSLDNAKFQELQKKVTSSTNAFSRLTQEQENELNILQFNNSEKLLEARAYDTYKSKLAEFVEEMIKGQTSLIEMRGDIERIDVRKQGDIEIATASARSSREAMLLRQDIESKAFKEKQPKEQEILLQEKELAAKRDFFTKENIAGLNRNTEALNNLTRLLAADFLGEIDSIIRDLQDTINKGSNDQSKPIGDKIGRFQLPKSMTAPEALKYFQDLKGVYSPSANLPMTSSGGNLRTAGSYLETIGNSVSKGSTFEQIQDQIGKFGVTPEMQNKFTEYAQQLLESYKVSNEAFKDKLKTLKEQQDKEKEVYDATNSYYIKLQAQIRSLEDSLTDPQSMGEYASKQRQIARNDRENALGSEEDKRAYRSSLRYGLSQGLEELEKRTLDYKQELGVAIPNLFSSNLAQGLNDAISGAKDLKTALTDAATAFFQEITRKNISNLADMVTGGLGSLAETGFSALKSAFPSGVTTKASGGFIKGGSGTKDDVPAMLMGGEYVVKKSAVSKYGKGFLDAINSGSMRGYATGGMVDPQTFPTQTGSGGFFTPGDYGQGAITGKNELLTFASQSFTGGQYDYMGGFGMGGATVSLEPESARLSALGREGSPMFERVQQSKDEAFRVYLEGLQKEKEYAELLDQRAKNEKARKKQLQMAIISAVASSALSAVGGAMSAGASNAAGAAKAAGKGILGQASAGFKGAFGFGGKTGQGGLGNLLTGNFSKAFTNLGSIAQSQGTTPQYNFGANKSLLGVTVGNRSVVAPATTMRERTLSANMEVLSEKNLSQLPLFDFGSDGGYRPYNSAESNPLLPSLSQQGQPIKTVPYRAAGGLISGGSNVRDDVPAMLTGGEFVLNNRATQRLGVQNLNKLNSGSSISSEGTAPSEVTQALMSKLDELIEATQGSSQSSVVVNVSSTDQQEENPADMNERDKELQKKIRQAVLDVIAQEKRLGGSLEKSR